MTQNDRKVIRFSKSFTKGQLKGTKTGTIRIFPVNEQLEECLRKAPIYNNKDLDLVFPSFEGKYIDLHNFTNRVFKPVVKKLIELGEIENDLTTYSLRHTFITQMVRKGIDISTIANLVGNSPETILEHYLNANKGITLPDLFN
jgi:site-specific recombinase XerD